MNNDLYSYETGSTRPPKSRRGLVAALLIAVILLCGISTGLSLLNIRLQLTLNASGRTAGDIQFSPVTAQTQSFPTGAADDASGEAVFGLDGQSLSELAQRFYRLPPGFWVREVREGSPAALAGLQPGDILTAINGVAVTDNDSILSLLSQLPADTAVTLQLYRNGSLCTLILNDDP